MSDNGLVLPTPDAFPIFPFAQPYDIQRDLMRHVYGCTEAGKVTVVESPTGTGKTLSLLTATLTWLRDDRARARKAILEDCVANDGSPSWVIEQTLERKRRELDAKERDRVNRLRRARQRERAQSAKHMYLSHCQKAHVSHPKTMPQDDRIYLPSDDEGPVDDDEGMSPAVRALFAKIEKGKAKAHDEEEDERPCTKIYYTSRTHSQLSQILPELPSSKRKFVDEESGETDDGVQFYTTRTVPLGSRKQLCINNDLRKLKGDLDEACRALLGEKGERRCPYLPPTDDEERILNLRDQILATPKDIEDLAQAGRVSGTCPYFGSRRAIAQAELITLPYNLLLQKSAREALGIDLKGQVVVIDEAHNLISTLLELSTHRLSRTKLLLAFSQVRIYFDKFRTRLKPAHVISLKRLIAFLEGLTKVVTEWDGDGDSVEIMTTNELLERLGQKAAGVNLLEVERYLKSSKIARKISSYCESKEDKASQYPSISYLRKGMLPPLHAVEEFMISLTDSNDDGRVMFSRTIDGDVELKYQLLNPAPRFQVVVDDARSVILAGGTMSPMSDVINQLFSRVAPERISSFSCGHVVPSQNLLALALTKGPRGGELEYKAGRQNNPDVIAELGQILINFACVVPRGLVVFFPSYNFLNTAKTRWTETGVLERIKARKQLFFEPTENAEVEAVLRGYTAAVHDTTPTTKKGGALLLAVVGAKLSEGLNFSDDLARAVMVVGLPYANLGSPELKERMDYVRRAEAKRLAETKTARPAGRKDAAAELYENMCMNAVNQSIGRAIRHRGDWAALILLDRRYAASNVRQKLPKWIGGGLVVADTFGRAAKELGAFYRSKM
ncbi:DNA repair helicase [Fistulina hepatica ATCC 64428]|uniref:ATP-dependent DNA helicase CHL1 n=1 Tax=Fistulina hepatica ATCC 64428 TaxID=1128425 RepID=A0A0D7AE59_9AGAR|nr:DNA repair helicase [Fistulina hepatica ATCC 64428]